MDATLGGFTVILRGESFILTKAQIESDAPSYFTASFFGGYEESAKRSLTLDRNPALFAFVVEHLSGYFILPLPENAIPGMSNQAALRNLRADAAFYGLERLQALLSKPVVYSPFGTAAVASQLHAFKRPNGSLGPLKTPSKFPITNETTINLIERYAHLPGLNALTREQMEQVRHLVEVAQLEVDGTEGSWTLAAAWDYIGVTHTVLYVVLKWEQSASPPSPELV